MRKIFGWLTVALLAVAPISASAAILWAGGEDTSVTFIGSPQVETGGSVGYDSNFSREALIVQNSTSTSDPPSNRIQTPTFTATSNSLWIHGVFYSGSSNATTSGEHALLVRSPDGVSRIVIRQTGTAGQLKISTRNAAGSFTDLGTFSATYTAATLTKLDIQINYTCSGSGAVNVWLAGTQVVAFTGNPCTDSATSLNQVEFMSVNNSNNVGTCSSTVGTCWSQLVVANENTQSFSLATLTLQGSGATQAWTPNTLANVNKTAISDTSFVSTSSNNQISEWTAPTSAPTGIWGVKTLIMNARLSISTTGPQNAEFISHVSGSDYTSLCPNPTLTTGFANYYCQTDLSPATGLVWGINEIFNTGGNQLGYGVESLM